MWYVTIGGLEGEEKYFNSISIALGYISAQMEVDPLIKNKEITIKWVKY